MKPLNRFIMANKRILKKQIKYICGDIAGECIMACKFIHGIDIAKMEDIVFKIAALQETSLVRVTFGYDKVIADFESAHEYKVARSKYFAEAYRTLINDFNNSIAEIVKEMNALLPEEQKAANKKALTDA